MKLVCVWCCSEGKPGDLGERAPREDHAPTHSLCARHQEQFLESLTSASFPEVELLLVVHPKDTALYEYLQRSLAPMRHVKVIMDRRADDRRREQRPVADDRRRERRRIRPGKVSSLGYVVVRFKRKSPPTRREAHRR